MNRPNALKREDLIEFENEIASLFNAGKIHAPIHLYYGNEDPMIEVFRDIKPEDWVMCSWRSHYQCLLKGVPRERLREEILAGRSISLCFPEYRVMSSAIVGGIPPIAVGVAAAIKRRGERSRVHCFLGDMTSETGIAHECIKYSTNHQLPIRFIIEDNGKSVCTDTREAWGQTTLTYEREKHPLVVFYKYQNKYPHAGAGVRVQF
jgi:pyruvate dehydrogenase E1 component alpha subunit